MREIDLGKQLRTRPLTDLEKAASPNDSQLAEITHQAYQYFKQEIKAYTKRVGNRAAPNTPLRRAV